MLLSFRPTLSTGGRRGQAHLLFALCGGSFEPRINRLSGSFNQLGEALLAVLSGFNRFADYYFDTAASRRKRSLWQYLVRPAYRHRHDWNARAQCYLERTRLERLELSIK
jgi:hypothetical protein